MGKSKKTSKSREPNPKLPAQQAAKTPRPQTHAFRETVESIVIAFVLAFLFRTFEAEAFVIPTGSMAPTLMGRHKDVDCPKCGYRYQVSASEENTDNRSPADCIAGMCPICHYVLPMVPKNELPLGAPERGLSNIPRQRSYNGDRILVNKYIYTFKEPDRWDVVVFKFPGDAKINYIKRLVGLPRETVRVQHGDLFIGGVGASEDGDFEIARKPPNKVLAMRQLVHDSNHDPAELESINWPLRWQASSDNGANGWKIEKSIAGTSVQQRYYVDSTSKGLAWLRYNHFVPNYFVWQRVAGNNAPTPPGIPPELADVGSPKPRLITDANPYNARATKFSLPTSPLLVIDPLKQGLHWVGDLMIEADVTVEAASGTLHVELIEAGQQFRCIIDLSSGEVTLGAGGDPSYAPKAKTPLNAPGEYQIAFANFDDQLLMWVDGELITFDTATWYDVGKVFGRRDRVQPQTSDEDPGDLAPARIGADGAKITVERLKLWRDIYYIADRIVEDQQRPGSLISEFGPVDWQSLILLPYDPRLWDMFESRQSVDFPLREDQFFVMGDNSAESSDARLWTSPSESGGVPGGPYLERRLLIGKALCVYWPHSWHRIPGTPIPFPFFPNFADMRLVR
jgi:signal peptidase I